MNKNEFVMKTAANILAAMYANTEKDPCEKTAIESAETLWNELVTSGFLPKGHDLSNDEFKHGIQKLKQDIDKKLSK